jgi:hypothetical protein
MRNNKKKNKIGCMDVVAFTNLGNYQLLVNFADNSNRIINFKEVFAQLQGDYTKWYKPPNFNKVQIENGNLIWGKDSDVIFTLESIYTGKVEKVKIN